jgi:hypothetical protein
MTWLLDHPWWLFLVTILVLWLSAYAGKFWSHSLRRQMDEDMRSDFTLVETATLTLLGLIIGFSFSMAAGRYDERKKLEEGEANAIGTEYLRVEVMPPEVSAKAKAQLREYTALRIRFYQSQNRDEVNAIRAETDKLDGEMWSGVSGPAAAQPTPVVALAVSGMNDVLNSEGYAQAAWWYRMPLEAWILMAVIAVSCTMMIGFGAKRPEPRLMVVLPLVVAVAFLLISDIDSPRGGLIRVVPVNLLRLQAGLK